MGSANVSSDEAAALLAMTDRSDNEDPHPAGPVGSLFMPHPATRGIRRVLETALTVLALPVVIMGLLFLAVAWRSGRRITQFSTQTLAYVSLLGGFTVYMSMSIAGVGSPRIRLATAILSSGALLLRRAVQLGAMSAKRRRRHARLAALSEKAPVASLPKALAKETAGTTETPKGIVLAAPPQVQPTAAGDEPSILG